MIIKKCILFTAYHSILCFWICKVIQLTTNCLVNFDHIATYKPHFWMKCRFKNHKLWVGAFHTVSVWLTIIWGLPQQPSTVAWQAIRGILIGNNHYIMFKLVTLIVRTLRQRSNKDTIGRGNADICCVLEARSQGSSDRPMLGKNKVKVLRNEDGSDHSGLNVIIKELIGQI